MEIRSSHKEHPSGGLCYFLHNEGTHGAAQVGSGDLELGSMPCLRRHGANRHGQASPTGQRLLYSSLYLCSLPKPFSELGMVLLQDSSD